MMTTEIQRSRLRKAAARPAAEAVLRIRTVKAADMPEVVALDATVTGLHKAAYWQRIYRRYGINGQGQRHFLVAVLNDRVCGFVIGEVRDWEFGSPPCGWVFAIDVAPEARQAGTGTLLLAASVAAFRLAGVRKLRTMLSRDNIVILSFFRSQGMMAGPLIPLEMDLAPPAGATPAAAR